MGKHFFGLVLVIFFLLTASLSWAATLRWNPVPSTEDCIIAGYNVYYGLSATQMTIVIDVEDMTSIDLDTLPLEPSTTYYFAVSAYSTTNLEGPMSSPIPYRDNPPAIVGFPLINFDENTIDITFSESNLQGADNKNNYSFSPTLIFNSTQEIALTDKTYRLTMDYIPEQTIMTMMLDSITDLRGQALTADSITLNDNDSDNMADDWEALYGISSPLLDADSDGLSNNQEYQLGTNPVNSDTDGDIMDDGWEVQNTLNPLVDDANEDIDGDNITNLQEYLEHTGAANKGPQRPEPQLPTDNSQNIGLSPQLTTMAYEDSENDPHAKTQWQISMEQSFEIPQDIVFELETFDSLTNLDVPQFILDANKTYFWRVRFFDIQGGRSLWSAPFSFSTIAINPEDSDNNGVPDIQQINDGVIDLNNDGHMDILSNTYKMITNQNTSLSLQASTNVTAVDCLKAIDPDEISDTLGRPQELPVGLIQFKISVGSFGDAAEIQIYFSEPVGTNWYKYDMINGWTEYSSDFPENIRFSQDRQSVWLRLVDGGAGDSDGVANGIIVDPSGPGPVAANSPNNGSPGGSGGGGGGGCFIATAAFGSPVEKHVQVLKDFRDEFLLKSRIGTSFVMTYYKYSPPIADIIARHNLIRAIVRIALMPLIVFGYIIVHASVLQQIMILLSLLSLSILVIIAIKKSCAKITEEISLLVS